jgi:hypothetical protein
MSLFNNFFGASPQEETNSKINWLALTSVSQLDEIEDASNSKLVVLFKHSTRCSISIMALRQFENDFEFIEEPEWEHSIQRFPNGKKVVVTVAREPMFEPVATFSYLFSFYFLFSSLSSRMETRKDEKRENKLTDIQLYNCNQAMSIRSAD